MENKGAIIHSEEDREYGLVLETANNKRISKLFGAIHYNFEFGKCVICSLQVHEKMRLLKFGSLLLSAAVKHANLNKIMKVELASTPESIPFYISCGFIPKQVFKDKQALKLWINLSKEQQTTLTSFFERIFCKRINCKD